MPPFTGASTKSIMSNASDLRFMEKRMKTLRTAVCSNPSEALLKFPRCLVSEMKFNPEGEILFAIKIAAGDMNGFDLEFPGHMRFFNKDFDYYIEADGNAMMTVERDKVGVRFQISHARYFYSVKLESRGVLRLFYIFLELLFVPKMSERLFAYRA